MKKDPISIVNLDETDDPLTIKNLADESGTVILEKDGKPYYVLLKWEGGDLSNPEDILRKAKRKLKRNLSLLQGITKKRVSKLKGNI
jgi:hypothetical protein